jgi:DNA replication protein DnaC
MPLKEVLPDGKNAIFVCSICNRDFHAEYAAVSDSFPVEVLHQIYDSMPCPECERKIRFAKVEEQKQIREAELAQSLSVRMKKAGFAELFQNIETPFIRSAAEWIYRNRFDNLLISGETGTGKTSGAAFVLRYMMRSATPFVMYRTWQQLHAELLAAKKSDSDSEMRFLQRIDHLDYLVIDELVARRGVAKLSPTGQDLLFNIVDGAYSGSRNTRVWILGNFYKGSIDQILDDPLPVRRRLQESFKLAVFRPDKTINTDLTIFEKSETESEEK